MALAAIAILAVPLYVALMLVTAIHLRYGGITQGNGVRHDPDRSLDDNASLKLPIRYPCKSSVINWYPSARNC